MQSKSSRQPASTTGLHTRDTDTLPPGAYWQCTRVRTRLPRSLLTWNRTCRAASVLRPFSSCNKLSCCQTASTARHLPSGCPSPTPCLRARPITSHRAPSKQTAPHPYLCCHNPRKYVGTGSAPLALRPCKQRAGVCGQGPVRGRRRLRHQLQRPPPQVRARLHRRWVLAPQNDAPFAPVHAACSRRDARGQGCLRRRVLRRHTPLTPVKPSPRIVPRTAQAASTRKPTAAATCSGTMAPPTVPRRSEDGVQGRGGVGACLGARAGVGGASSRPSCQPLAHVHGRGLLLRVRRGHAPSSYVRTWTLTVPPPSPPRRSCLQGLRERGGVTQRGAAVHAHGRGGGRATGGLHLAAQHRRRVRLLRCGTARHGVASLHALRNFRYMHSLRLWPGIGPAVWHRGVNRMLVLSQGQGGAAAAPTWTPPHVDHGCHGCGAQPPDRVCIAQRTTADALVDRSVCPPAPPA